VTWGKGENEKVAVCKAGRQTEGKKSIRDIRRYKGFPKENQNRRTKKGKERGKNVLKISLQKEYEGKWRGTSLTLKRSNDFKKSRNGWGGNH